MHYGDTGQGDRSAGLAAGARVAVRRAEARPPGTAAGERWLTVTVNCAPHDVQADQLPSPPQEYGDRIETRIRPRPVTGARSWVCA